jgi:nitrile hydratase
MEGNFEVGQRVRVRSADPAGHVRTPAYVRGRVGQVVRRHGAFRNPEELAYGRDGLPKRELYLVAFRGADLWDERDGRSGGDRNYVDIYEHWLEPVEDRENA